MNTRNIQLTLVFALIACAASSVSAKGGFIQGFPGTTCKPSNLVQETYYEYVDDSLVNTGTGVWDLFIAVCPLSEVERSAEAEQIRVLLKDSEKREAWCRLVYTEGKELQAEWLTFSGSEGHAVFAAPPWADQGILEGTIHCLVRPGAKLERISVVWNDEK